MFGFFKRWRRRRLGKRPFPDAWHGHLERRVPFSAGLSGEIRERFLHQLKIFVWDKEWIGAGGFEIDDEVRVVIASSAVRLTLHLDLSYYDRLTEIIVYPDAFQRPGSDEWILGEAHSWGTVVFAWTAVVQGLANPDDGHATAAHEFAHVLDRHAGAFDGTPVLHARAHYEPWGQVMSQHFLALRRGARRARKVLRNYGAQSEPEFFAVATEAFFEKPDQMRTHAPDLYAELQRFYRWDPASRA